MKTSERLEALNAVIEELDYEDGNSLVHAMLGSLSALVSDDHWTVAMGVANQFVSDTAKRRAERSA